MRAKAIGPGILFAGAAIGVSHLVQATRAGAGYGLGLVFLVIVANVVKYPAFSFGPRYAAATGCSLLEGYRRQGRWALAVYGIITVGTMFTVQAAVTFTTAALAVAVLGVGISPMAASVGLLTLCIAILRIGHYRWLDRVVKVVVVALTLLTLAATVLVLPKLEWETLTFFPVGLRQNVVALGFVAALIGWMPSAIDISVWHSLWGLARRRETGYRPTISEALFDFNVGYVGTAILALCFVILGAAVVHGRGGDIPSGAAPFALMVLDLYEAALGAWARPIFGTAALLVMFSTTLTVVDGFPRAFSALAVLVSRPEEPGADVEQEHRLVYWCTALVLAAGTLLVLAVVRTRLLDLIDVATILSFLTAPILAALNHRAVVAASCPPGRAMRIFSLISIVLLASFASIYLYLRFWIS